MIRVIEIKFKTSGRVYYFDPLDLPIKAGDGANATSGATAYAQNYDAGTEVPAGTVVEITFINRTEG